MNSQHNSPPPPLRPVRVQLEPALAQLQYRSVSAPSDSEPEVAPAAGTRRQWLTDLKKYGKWWLVFAGIYASSSVCPFCGKPGCPVGPGAASLVGLVFAWVITFGKNLRQRLQTLLATFWG